MRIKLYAKNLRKTIADNHIVNPLKLPGHKYEAYRAFYILLNSVSWNLILVTIASHVEISFLCARLL